MDLTTSLQLAILAGAYVLALAVVSVATVFSILNLKSSRRLETKRDYGSRITKLENELISYKDLVESLGARLTRRIGLERKRTSESSENADSSDGAVPTITSGDDVLRLWKQRNG